jgi:hypothetical protein
MGNHNANGTLKKTSVNGLTRVGLFAADGSTNVVLDDAGGKGIYHASGALRVNSGTSNQMYDASGAYYSNYVMGYRS